jgi:hypothetical protein
MGLDTKPDEPVLDSLETRHVQIGYKAPEEIVVLDKMPPPPARAGSR